MVNCYTFCFIAVVIHASAVKGFSWESCGEETDPVKITKLTGTVSGSRLLISATGKIAFNLDGPMKTQIDVRKKIFWQWTKIPCTNHVGSCTIDDLCRILPFNGTDCPPEYKDNALPCHCPFPQGRYAAKNFPIDLSFVPQWLEKGFYKIKVNILNKGQQLMCLVMAFKI